MLRALLASLHYDVAAAYIRARSLARCRWSGVIIRRVRLEEELAFDTVPRVIEHMEPHRPQEYGYPLVKYNTRIMRQALL